MKFGGAGIISTHILDYGLPEWIGINLALVEDLIRFVKLDDLDSSIIIFISHPKKEVLFVEGSH